MRRVDGAKVTRLTPGDLSVCSGPTRSWARKVARRTMGRQKSAEAKVAASHAANGPNTWSRPGTEHSMRPGDVASRAERPERPEKASGGTAHGPGVDRQARTACEGNAGDGAPMLMEEVVRRENLMNWVSCVCSRSIRGLRALREPPCTEPYARWCGSWGWATVPGYPMCAGHDVRQKGEASTKTTSRQFTRSRHPEGESRPGSDLEVRVLWRP
jgi:hypothetical protein